MASGRFTMLGFDGLGQTGILPAPSRTGIGWAVGSLAVLVSLGVFFGTLMLGKLKPKRKR